MSAGPGPREQEAGIMKKRFWSMLLALALVLALLPGSVFASGAGDIETGGGGGGGTSEEKPNPAPDPDPDPPKSPQTLGNVEYTLVESGDQKSWKVTKYTGSDTTASVSIREKVDNLPVTVIADNVFSGKTTITSVTLPKTITAIGDYAFFNTKLSSVTIPIAVKEIGGYAFSKCANLKTVTFASGVSQLTKLGERAFSECGGLTAFTIPENVTELGSHVFLSSGLKNITIPGKIQTIPDNAFANCTGLTGLTIQGGVTTIEASAFSGCTKLTSVTLPDKLTDIKASAFQECGFSTLILPPSVKTIGKAAFYSCANLQNIYIPATVTQILDDTFSGTKVTTIHYAGATKDSEGKLVGPTGLPEDIEVHSASSRSSVTSEPSCSKEGTVVWTTTCKSTTCKVSFAKQTRYTPKTEHTPVVVPAVPATCTKKGKTEGEQCDICKVFTIPQEVTDLVPHTEKKEVVTVDPTCGTAGKKTTTITCSVCNAPISTKEEILPALEGEHEPEEKRETVSEKAPTCTEKGFITTKAKCKKCGGLYDEQTKELEATGVHIADDAKTVEAVIVEAACNTEGLSVTFPACKFCGTAVIDDKYKDLKTKEAFIEAGIKEDDIKILEKLPHTYDENIDPDKADVKEGSEKDPTCTEAGSKVILVPCTVCGEKTEKTVETAKPLGHKPKDPVTETIEDPTCTEPGSRKVGVVTCEVCKDILEEGKTETVPATGHTVKDTDTKRVEPTCTTPGSITKTGECQTCRAQVDEVEAIPPTGHTLSSNAKETRTKEPSCTEPGILTISYACEVCGEAVQNAEFPIDPKGHDFENGVCKVCGVKQEDIINPPNPDEDKKPGEDDKNPDEDDDKKDDNDNTTVTPTLYDVNLIRTSNGSISSSVSRAAAGETVRVTATPYAGYELDYLRVTRRNGNTVSLSGHGGGQYTFTMPSSWVDVSAVFVRDDYYYAPGTNRTPTPAPSQIEIPTVQSVPKATASGQIFADIPSSYWASGEIAWAYQRGLMGGTGFGRFTPDGTITFQQMWMVLARITGSRPANMEAARQWAVENGFAEGANPATPITRQQLVTALYRTAVLLGRTPAVTGNLAKYTDSATVSAPARNAMTWAVSNGILSGTSDNRLNPNATSTRAQFAVILYRFCQRTF